MTKKYFVVLTCPHCKGLIGADVYAIKAKGKGERI